MEYNARAESGGRQLDFTAQPRLDWEPAGLADRNRVQMTYVPARATACGKSTRSWAVGCGEPAAGRMNCVTT